MKRIALVSASFIFGFFLTIGLYFAIAKKHVLIISPLAGSQFSFEKAPRQSLQGQIIKITGSVFFQSRTATQSSSISSPHEISQGEEVDTGDDGIAQVSFDKIVNLNLHRNAKINIIQSLSANLVMELKEGTAEFQNLESPVAVSVRGLDILINIQKGDAVITVNKQNSKVTLNVVNGQSIAAFTDSVNRTIVKTIQPGQNFVFNNNAKTFALY